MINKINLALITLLISLSLAGQPSVSQAAAPLDVQVSFPDFPVTVNGTVMDVKHSQYPLLIYKDITYFPMTWNNTAALGLSMHWDTNSGLSLQKNNACVPLKQDLNTQIHWNDNSQTAALAPFPIQVNGKTIINTEEPYPLLLYRNITYFPMSWKFTKDALGWKTSWGDHRGFEIESCGGMSNNQMEQTVALNLANSGQLAVQGDWIYMNPDGNYEGPNRLVKVKKDGTGEVKLSDDNATSINIVDDWLYYTVKMDGIYKIKTDGTQRSQVSAVPAAQIWVQGDRIFYIHHTFQLTDDGNGYYSPTSIHSMNTDGSGDQELVSGIRMYPFFMNDGQIYFVKQENENEPANLYRMNLDGYEQSKLQDNVSRAIAIDGWIYYICDYGKQLNKMSEDGSVIIPLYTSDHWITTLHYRQGWIYMMNGTFGIQRSAYIDKLRIDGTELAGLGEARSAALYFVDKSLYLSQNSWQRSNTLVHMDVD